jgi:hypothetical protein
MNPASGAERSEKHARRLDWLRTWPALADLPGAADDVTPAKSEALDRVLRAMKLVKLYAPSSGPDATRWGIRLLVSELRGQHVEGTGQRWNTGRR